MSIEDRIYVPGSPIQLKPGKWYALLVDKERDNSSRVLLTMPPQSPGYWVYRFHELKDKEDVKNISEHAKVISVFKVSESYEVKRKYKDIKKEITVPEFDGYEFENDGC